MSRFAPLVAWALVAGVALHAGSARAELKAQINPVALDLTGVGVDQRLGERLETNVKLKTHDGREVSLSDYFDGKRPTLITMNYVKCASICGAQLAGVADSLAKMDGLDRDQFQVITIALDPSEGLELATAKRQGMLERVGGDPPVHWEYLTGTPTVRDAVAKSLGFGFRYDEETQQFAHPGAVALVSPDGIITRYLNGVLFDPEDLRLAFLEASQGKVGDLLDQVVLSCFYYDATRGSYVPRAIGIMRLGGVVTVLFLVSLLGGLWVRERRRTAQEGG